MLQVIHTTRAPAALLTAPTKTPVRRLDETRANREPDVRWRLESAQLSSTKGG
ncbi:MAG: hypothetical protein ACETWG_06580 [Candidatus Neomarinimicrobiota bacterium]